MQEIAGSVSAENLVHVDPGGFSDLFSEPGKIRSRCLLEVYAAWQMQAVNISARELAAGIDTFEELIAGVDVPVISANVINQSTDSARYQTHVITTIADTRVAFVGMARPVLKQWELDDGETVFIGTPEKYVASLITRLRGEVDMVVLLAHYPYRKLEDLLAELPPVDVVIGADGYSVVREPEIIDGAAVSYAGKEGQKLCWMRLPDAAVTAGFEYEWIHLAIDMPEAEAVKEKAEACEAKVREFLEEQGEAIEVEIRGDK